MARTIGNPTEIVVPPLNWPTILVTVVGDTSLVSHQWSEKAKEEMRAKQGGGVRRPKQPKSPEQDFYDSLYWLTPKPDTPNATVPASAKFGFPSVAFKAAAVTAVTQLKGTGVTKVMARQVFHVYGVDRPDLVTIDGPAPVMREDMVRVGMGTADLRYRGEFTHWRATLRVEFNADMINAAHVLNLFQHAGKSVGVGEWRPEKDGMWGLFHPAKQEEMQEAA